MIEVGKFVAGVGDRAWRVLTEDKAGAKIPPLRMDFTTSLIEDL